MGLKTVSKEVYKLLDDFNAYMDELPLKDEREQELNYLDNIYVTYSFKGASDGSYKDVVDLEVQVITNKKNKFEAQEIANLINNRLNKKKLTNARITKKNAWYVDFIDEEGKENIILQYNLDKY